MTTASAFHTISREEKRDDLSSLIAMGPLSLLCTACVALQHAGNLDLMVIIFIGSLLCLKLRTKGLVYCLILLALGSFWKHHFFLDFHLWRFGVETSLSLGLLITAMTSELIYQQKEGLSIHVTSQEQTVRNLEEELAKVRKEAQEEQILLSNRLAANQAELEETTRDLSALHILNDVLRQANARMTTEQENLLKEYREKELNLRQEYARYREALTQEYSEKELPLQQVNSHLQQALAQEQQQKQSQEQVKAENGRLKETLESQERLMVALEERLKEYSQEQGLYQQLRSQFEEKNRILHLTRRRLFALETQLQGLFRDQEMKQQDPSFSPLEKDLAYVEHERLYLEQENGELTELVTTLSQEQKKKKHSKKTEEPALF